MGRRKPSDKQACCFSRPPWISQSDRAWHQPDWSDNIARMPTTPFIEKTEAERLQDLSVLLASICRKASLQAEANPAAAELLDLAHRAEALVDELARLHTN